jgi:hypothetical protein
MELTTLDTDLIRLHQTLGELIAMGLVEPFATELGSAQTRYRIAGRPGDEEEEEAEAEAPARLHAGAA